MRHLNLSDYSDTQEDVYFITYNVYNDFLKALRQSSSYYVTELHSRTDQKKETILVIFLSSIGTLLLTMFILFPVISNVSKARMKVLSLFVDIPNHHVITLANKCEKFITSFLEENNEEIESEDEDDTKADDTDTGNNQLGKRNIHKSPKNQGSSNSKIFI